MVKRVVIIVPIKHHVLHLDVFLLVRNMEWLPISNLLVAANLRYSAAIPVQNLARMFAQKLIVMHHEMLLEYAGIIQRRYTRRYQMVVFNEVFSERSTNS